jgi:nucleotide-binding universal stress UspA family protein
MYRRIIVPLDGTPFGDQALPPAVDLALRLGAMLELVHAGAPADRRELEEKAAAIELRYPVEVRTRILEGETEEAVASAVGDIVADLVVLATHARTGVSRVRHGSLAMELLARLNVPTLCVHPAGEEGGLVCRPMRRILVALDGSSFSEQVLDPLAPLATALRAQVTLLTVVTPVPLLGGALGQPHRGILNREDALFYLQEVAQRWQGHIPEPVLLALEDRRPANLIATLLAAGEYDTVAMATHGRSGLSALLTGSVASDVLASTHAPVLLYRPREARLPAAGFAEFSVSGE